MTRLNLIAATSRLPAAVLILALGGLIVGSLAWTEAAALEPASGSVKVGLPDKTIPQSLGFNAHIAGPDRDWDMIKDAGVKYIRKDFDWGQTERQKGQYNFSQYDHILASLDARGIHVLFILDYRNNLYQAPETTDEGRDAYARWAAAAAKHFAGRGVMWEIWNEPNVGFWHGAPPGAPNMENSIQYADQYVALVKKTVPAMRAADPNCFILAGSISCLWSNSFRWATQTFKDGLLSTGISGLSVHPYGFARPELCIQDGYGHLRDLIVQAGAPRDFPILNTEVGYSETDNGVAKGVLAQEHRAMLFVRQYMVDQMCNIKMTIWYNWNDDKVHRIVENDLTPLPMYKACQNMVKELAGYRYVDKLDVGSSQDYALIFANAAGGRKVVAWTVPQGRDVSQDRARAHDINIPAGAAASAVTARDLYGKPVPVTVAGTSAVVNITASPVYLGLGR